MFKKKKAPKEVGKECPKEGFKPKKQALITAPCFNLPEQPRTMELKSLIKSIELRKNSNPNPYIKPASRKSNCKSVKQGGFQRPSEMKSIMQTFKELKQMHEQERSKSKSPASCKSRSNKKHLPFKGKSNPTLGIHQHNTYFTHPHTLATNPNSQVSLTLKLERTIKQLHQTDFFRDQDSLMPIRSTSDQPPSDQVRPQRLHTDHEEEINLEQLRSFCSTIKLGGTGKFQKTGELSLSLKTYNSFRENRAALKIQRAWRQFQTKRLVKRYVYLSQHQEDAMHVQHHHNHHNSPVSDGFHQLLPSEQLRMMEQLNGIRFHETESLRSNTDPEVLPLPDAIVVSSDEFYREGEGRVRHVSNLEEVANAQYEQIVKRMKMEQLQKWNQIIEIIAHTRSDSPHQLENLLQKLTKQSEINKKELEAKANQILARSQHLHSEQKEPKHEVEEEEEDRVRLIGVGQNKREYSSSGRSAGLQEYDSKKYIEYLDGDIFPIENDHSSSENQRGARISRRKQERLLEELRTSNLPIKLGESSLYRSQSAKALQRIHRRRPSGGSRSSLRRSSSEKVLRSAMEDMSFEQQVLGSAERGEGEEELNLDLLTKEFLEGSDPSADNFDMVYSEEKLRSKLAELSKLKEEEGEGDGGREGEDEREEAVFRRDQQEEEEVSLRRSQPSFQLHQPQIKIEDGTPEKVQVQVVQHDILSDSDEQQNEKGEACSAFVLNALIMEVLRDIAKSDPLADAFKSYSLAIKAKATRKPQGKKKKGFPTSKAEIELFLEGLLRYLSKEEPGIFRNLQVATGPSALEMLRYMHQSGQAEAEQVEQDEDEDESNVMVIPNRVFDAFWQLKERSIVIEVPPHFDQTNAVIFRHHLELLKSFNKIFYRSLFDTFNECLDCQRNFGQYGRPFPWKRAPVFDHHKSQAALQTQVQAARKKMVELSTTYCGLIIEKQDMGASINQDYVRQVHEDRLSRMLASDLLQGEERWVFYDDEETEILVEVAGAIYTEMLVELIEELYEGV